MYDDVHGLPAAADAAVKTVETVAVATQAQRTVHRPKQQSATRLSPLSAPGGRQHQLADCLYVADPVATDACGGAASRAAAAAIARLSHGLGGERTCVAMCCLWFLPAGSAALSTCDD